MHGNSLRMDREIQEACQAGERALHSLYAARDKLASARNWGILDMFGGNVLSGMIKHSRLEDASHLMEQARNDLRTFECELQDVNFADELHLRIDDFLTFADFFFDNFLTDYLVQNRIADARRQVEDAISRVETVMGELRRYRV